MTTITKYNHYFKEMINNINTLKLLAIPVVISTITTEILPQILVDVNHLQTLKDSEKKQFVITTVKLFINELFVELNKRPEFANTTKDDDIKNLLLKSITPILDNLIVVKHGKVSLHKPKIEEVVNFLDSHFLGKK